MTWGSVYDVLWRKSRTPTWGRCMMSSAAQFMTWRLALFPGLCLSSSTFNSPFLLHLLRRHKRVSHSAGHTGKRKKSCRSWNPEIYTHRSWLQSVFFLNEHIGQKKNQAEEIWDCSRLTSELEVKPGLFFLNLKSWREMGVGESPDGRFPVCFLKWEWSKYLVFT